MLVSKTEKLCNDEGRWSGKVNVGNSVERVLNSSSKFDSIG